MELKTAFSMYKIYILQFCVLFITVPWFYKSSNLDSIYGFPVWAFYSILFTFIYAVIIFYILSKYWPNSNSTFTEDK